MKLARSGEAALVTRRLAGRHDPVALHAALAGDGDTPLLFRRSGGRALILVDAALKLEASAQDATVEAQDRDPDRGRERRTPCPSQPKRNRQLDFV